MSAPYEWILGTRYLRSTQRRGFLSFISIVSVLGLAVGVAVLLVVLSVMNGFERELKTRILSVTSHATLMGLNGTLPNWRDAERQAGAYPGVVAAVPYVEAQAMLAHGNVVSGTVVRGVDPPQELKAVGLAQRISGGSVLDLQPGRFQIVLGDTLAETLALARLAKSRGVKHGVVQDKLFLPGIRKLKRLIDGGFFGRIFSVRGDFGYWVFEGDWQPSQRPSWNYRSEDGGGIIADML